MPNDTPRGEVEESKRPRPRFSLMRFSLRSMLVITTLFSLLMGVWAIYVQPYRDQAASVQWTREHGGEVTQRAAHGPPWQAWLVHRMIGPDTFIEVHRATLSGVDQPEQAQRHLAGLRFAEQLMLDRLPVDERAALTISGFKNLQDLSLRYTGIDDQSVAALAECPSLERLLLTGAPVTDQGLAQLAKCATLDELFVRWTDITAAGVAQFKAARPECATHFHELGEL